MSAMSENPLASSDLESLPARAAAAASSVRLAESNGVTAQLVEDIKKQVNFELLAEADQDGIGSPFSMGVRRTVAQLTEAPTNWQ